jgi:chitinase
VDICPTGFTTIVTVITTTVCPEATATTGVRPGWYTTVTVCDKCGPAPTTVTLTKPYEHVPTSYVYAESSSLTKPMEQRPTAYVVSETEAMSTTTIVSTHLNTEYVTIYPATLSSAVAPASSATGHITKVVTLAVSAVPYKAVSAASESSESYVVPTGAATGGYVAPTGIWSASAGVPYASSTPLSFEGAANRAGVGMGMVAAFIAAVFAL